jgi:hypothetical protein
MWASGIGIAYWEPGMNHHRHASGIVFIGVIVLTLAADRSCGQADQPKPDEPAAADTTTISSQGRLLYANDDDWDWVSPKDIEAEKRSRLAAFGSPGFSALDDMEKGLPTVRGLVIGTLPINTLDMPELNRLRGDGKTKPYRHTPFKPGGISKLLAGDEAPTIIILMQQVRPVFQLTKPDIDALSGFLRRGGRLLMLDDRGGDYTAFTQLAKRLRPPAPKLDPEQQKQRDAARTQRVHKLVEQLGDAKFTIRQQAADDLLAMGKAIAPTLRSIKSDDPEVTIQIERILAAFEPPLRTAAHGQVSNEDMKALYIALLQHWPKRVELKPMTRDAGAKAGQVLILQLPERKLPEPAEH